MPSLNFVFSLSNQAMVLLVTSSSLPWNAWPTDGMMRSCFGSSAAENRTWLSSTLTNLSSLPTTTSTGTFNFEAASLFVQSHQFLSDVTRSQGYSEHLIAIEPWHVYDGVDIKKTRGRRNSLTAPSPSHKLLNVVSVVVGCCPQSQPLNSSIALCGVECYSPAETVPDHEKEVRESLGQEPDNRWQTLGLAVLRFRNQTFQCFPRSSKING